MDRQDSQPQPIRKRVKPRVNWTAPAEVQNAIKVLAEIHRRSESFEAEEAMIQWISRHIEELRENIATGFNEAFEGLNEQDQESLLHLLRRVDVEQGAGGGWSTAVTPPSIISSPVSPPGDYTDQELEALPKELIIQIAKLRAEVLDVQKAYKAMKEHQEQLDRLAKKMMHQIVTPSE